MLRDVDMQTFVATWQVHIDATRAQLHHACRVGCDSCGLYPIKGRRFKCQDCPDKVGFDLCGQCCDRGLHITGRFNQQHTAGTLPIPLHTALHTSLLDSLQDVSVLRLASMLKFVFCRGLTVFLIRRWQPAQTAQGSISQDPLFCFVLLCSALYPGHKTTCACVTDSLLLCRA